MTTQHTPGPWSVGQQEFSRHGVALEGNVHVIRMHGACGAAIYSMGCEASETEATARLIAAAPALLAALEGLLNVGDSVLFQQRAREAARAAIAKAKGES